MGTASIVKKIISLIIIIILIICLVLYSSKLFDQGIFGRLIFSWNCIFLFSQIWELLFGIDTESGNCETGFYFCAMIPMQLFLLGCGFHLFYQFKYEYFSPLYVWILIYLHFFMLAVFIVGIVILTVCMDNTNFDIKDKLKKCCCFSHQEVPASNHWNPDMSINISIPPLQVNQVNLLPVNTQPIASNLASNVYYPHQTPPHLMIQTPNECKIDINEGKSEEKEDSKKDENKCSICYVNIINAVIDPCGHRLCFEGLCKTQLSGKCHICRKPINKIIKFY